MGIKVNDGNCRHSRAFQVVVLIHKVVITTSMVKDCFHRQTSRGIYV